LFRVRCAVLKVRAVHRPRSSPAASASGATAVRRETVPR